MPFGRHRGEDLADLDAGYLEWLNSLPDLREPLRSGVDRELENREWNRRFERAYETGQRARDERRQDRQQARETRHVDGQAALALISAGHRALALRNHPDTGGKPDVMRRLNTAREWLETTVRNALGDGR